MLNRWQGIGNLGRDPEIRSTRNGDPVANFSLAVNEKYKDKKTGQQQEVTEWVNLVAWGRYAEIVGEYCTKGSKIYAEGKLRTRKWEDQGGNARYTTEVILNGLTLLDSKPRTKTEPSRNRDERPEPASRDEFEDDLPF